MRMLRNVACLLALVTIVALSACGDSTGPTPVVQVYPTRLDVPHVFVSLNVGDGYGVGVAALIIGKEEFEPSDSIAFVIRNPALLAVTADYKGQSLRKDLVPGFMTVYLNRTLDLRGVREGSTYLVFMIADQADSIFVTVNPTPKG